VLRRPIEITALTGKVDFFLVSGYATNQDLNLLHEPIFCATIQQ
jgi:hypothetical protein